MISDEARVLVVCPICHARLTHSEASASCDDCGHVYPVRDGVPELIFRDSPFFDGEKSADDDVAPPVRSLLPAWVQRVLRPYLALDPPLTMFINRSLFHHLNECPPGMTILNLGSGEGKFDEHVAPHLRFINLDIAQTPKGVDVMADAHFLPFADQSVDAVYSNAVLEHVQRPWRVADEIYRVVRPGGKVFVNVPFLNVIHDTHDYFRFTDKGLRVLFSRFDEVDSGASAGPSSFLGPFLVEYVLCFVPGRYLKAFMRRPLSLVAWPLKYLDLLIRRSSHLRITADAFYFVGVRRP